jgi:hypothetical protein
VIDTEEPGCLCDGDHQVRHLVKFPADAYELVVRIQDSDIEARRQVRGSHRGLSGSDRRRSSARPFTGRLHLSHTLFNAAESVEPLPHTCYAKPAGLPRPELHRGGHAGTHTVIERMTSPLRRAKESCMRTVLWGALLVITLAVSPIHAQSGKPVHFIIGGGMSTPLGGVADRFDTGGAFNIGLTFEPEPPFGLQVEYGFHKLNGPEARIPLTSGTALIESNHKVHYFVANAMLHGGGTRRFNPYGLAGGGMYYRTVSLTTPDVGLTAYCDPFWYFCYAEPVELDRVIGRRSTWDPGVNIGGGLAIRMGHAAAFYIEARWHHTWGPAFTDLGGVEQRVDGNYFPVTFGFKF